MQIACPILTNASLEDVKALHSFCATLPPFELVGFHLLVQQLIPNSCSFLGIRLCSDRQNSSSYHRTWSPKTKHLAISLSVCLSIQASISPSICPSVHPFIHQLFLLWQKLNRFHLSSVHPLVVPSVCLTQACPTYCMGALWHLTFMKWTPGLKFMIQFSTCIWSVQQHPNAGQNKRTLLNQTF